MLSHTFLTLPSIPHCRSIKASVDLLITDCDVKQPFSLSVGDLSVCEDDESDISKQVSELGKVLVVKAEVTLETWMLLCASVHACAACLSMWVPGYVHECVRGCETNQKPQGK